MKTLSIKNVSSAIYKTTMDKNGSDLTIALENIVLFLKRNKLLSKSKDILYNLEKIIDKENSIIRATVTSRVPLSKEAHDELVENIKKRYKAKQVEIDQIEDKSIISGIKVEIEDEVIDLSVSHQLHQLQNYLIKN